MISENIHEAPLVKFMADHIKNIIESGQVYTARQFQILLRGMSDSDLRQKEVQTFIQLIEDEMPSD
jgi:hypothetical protein